MPGGSWCRSRNVTPKVEVHLQAIVTRELTLYGSCASSGEYPLCLELLGRGVIRVDDLHNGSMSALFEGTVEATEEAIYNSLFKAETVTSNGRMVRALPLDQTMEVLRRYGVVR